MDEERETQKRGTETNVRKNENGKTEMANRVPVATVSINAIGLGIGIKSFRGRFVSWAIRVVLINSAVWC